MPPRMEDTTPQPALRLDATQYDAITGLLSAAVDLLIQIRDAIGPITAAAELTAAPPAKSKKASKDDAES